MDPARPARLPELIDAAPLTIRRWSPPDAEAMTAMIAASLDHLRPWMAWASDEPLAHETRLRQFHAWDRYWESGRGAVYGVFEAGSPIGGAALHRRVGPGGLDIGYWLSASATGHGHASRIASALTAAACASPGVTFALISHALDNAASAAVAQRVGYSPAAPPDATNGGVTSWRFECGNGHAAARSGTAGDG
ncbi:MAG: GNAT family N-acetyltransferase [Ilumatobacter sp.]|nr:GNAT family N-acetyltransferase [Ilumatobacter sp.]